LFDHPDQLTKGESLDFRPDNFLRDWYGHVTNQGSHGGLVGIGLALPWLALLPPVLAWLAVVVCYAAYEVVAHWYFDDAGNVAWDWPDSLDDTSNVAGGAAVICAAFLYVSPFWPAWWASVGAFAIWAGFLALSTLRRMRA
jgi:hypothetical protein